MGPRIGARGPWIADSQIIVYLAGQFKCLLEETIGSSRSLAISQEVCHALWRLEIMLVYYLISFDFTFHTNIDENTFLETVYIATNGSIHFAKQRNKLSETSYFC